MSLYAKLAIALIVFLGGIALGIKWEKGQQAIRDVAAREQEREVKAQRERAGDLAAEGHEKDKAQIREKYVVITEEVEHEIATSDFYAAGAPACLDDGGMRELARAIGSSAAASQPASAVRAASASR